MKKMIASVALSMAAFSPFAFSAAAPISSGTPIVLTDCALLADDVRITLSNGVLGAYNCIAASNNVLVSTCHANGRVASRSIDTPCVNELDADEEVAATQTLCENDDVAYNRATASGAAIIVGKTAGGAIGPLPLDSSTCDAATVAGKI